MRKIKLTKGLVALVDDEAYEYLNQWKWLASEQGSQRKPYAIRWIKDMSRPPKVWIDEKTGRKRTRYHRKKVWMHRLIMMCPAELVVDHRDGDGLNNQKSNLEVVTWEENFLRSQHKRKRVEDFVL